MEPYFTKDMTWERLIQSCQLVQGVFFCRFLLIVKND